MATIAQNSDGDYILRIDTETGNIVLQEHKWPRQDGSSGQVLTTDGQGNLYWSSGGGGGSSSFIGLTDTPSSYSGQANLYVRVKSDESGLEFVTAPSGGLTEVYDDKSPQLGGDLDVLAQKITTSTLNQDIVLQNNGSGAVVITDGTTGAVPIRITKSSISRLNETISISGYGVNIDATSSAGFISLDGSKVLVQNPYGTDTLEFVSGTGVIGGSTVWLGFQNTGWSARTNTLRGPTGTAVIDECDQLWFGPGDASKPGIGDLVGDGKLTIYGAAADVVVYTGSELDVQSGVIKTTTTNGNLTLQPEGSGHVVIDYSSWPNLDGADGQTIETDGAGNLSWSYGGLDQVTMFVITPRTGINYVWDQSANYQYSIENITVQLDSGSCYLNFFKDGVAILSNALVTTTEATHAIGATVLVGEKITMTVTTPTSPDQLGITMRVRG